MSPNPQALASEEAARPGQPGGHAHSVRGPLGSLRVIPDLTAYPKSHQVTCSKQIVPRSLRRPPVRSEADLALHCDTL